MEIETPTIDQQPDAPTEARSDSPPDIDTPVVDHTFYVVPEAVKSIGEGRIGGYLVAFGFPKDAHGEYFTSDTDLKLQWYSHRPVLWHHGVGGVDALEIGVITSLKVDAKGIYAEADLYINHEDPTIRAAARKAHDMVLAGELGWSSGSIPHLVKIDTDGRITQWPIVEGSLTPTPAEPHRTTVAAIRAKFSELRGDAQPDAKEQADEPEAKEQTAGESATKHSSQSLSKKTRGGLKMFDQATVDSLREKGFDSDQILDIMSATAPSHDDDTDGMMADDEDKQDDLAGMSKTDATSVKTYTEDDIAKIVDARLEQAKKTAPAPDPDLGGVDKTKDGKSQRLEVGSRYQHMSVEDMAFAKTMMDAARIAGRKSGPWDPGQKFWRELADKAEKSVKSGDLALNDAAVKTIRGIKDDELNHSTLASYGDEFVPELWANQLWRKPRIDNVVAANTTFIDMPSNPYKLPIEGADPHRFGSARDHQRNTVDVG